MDSSEVNYFEMGKSETMPIQNEEEVMEAKEPQEDFSQDRETLSNQVQTDFATAPPGSSVHEGEETLVAKIKETWVRLLESGGQSTPIIAELRKQLLDLKEPIDAKTDTLLFKYCAANFPSIERKALKQAILVAGAIDLANMPDFRFLPLKKVLQLITLGGEKSVLDLLEKCGIDAASSNNCNSGIQAFEFQIDRLIDDLKSERAADGPKKNGIMVLGKTAEKFVEKAKKALGDDKATTEEEIEELLRMKDNLCPLVDIIISVIKDAEDTLTSP